tara:strand:+ start:441 stop:1982 length:1542 start_codon:yes stop_codon:yes gene_type:complete
MPRPFWLRTKHTRFSLPAATVFLAPLLLSIATGFAQEVSEQSSASDVSSRQMDDILKQLEEVRAQNEQIRSENQQMREEIDFLHADATRDWLTEQRAEEIKELVQDVLADADTRSSLMGSGLMAGWSDGFFLASADGRFRLNVGALMQVRFMANILNGGEGSVLGEDGTRYGFENTTTRINLGGHVFDDTEFFIEMGFGRTDPFHFTADDQVFGSRLYEAWVRHRLTDNIAIKAGIFKLPYTREFLVYEGLQLAVERSLIDYRFGLGRSQGVQLDVAMGPVRGQLAYTNGSTALFSLRGLGENVVPPWAAYRADTEWSVTGRLEWLLQGEWEQFRQFTSPTHEEFGMMIGVAGHGQSEERDRTSRNFRNTLYGVTADLSVDFGGASAFASIIYEHQLHPGGAIQSIDYWGMVVQGSMYLDPKWEVYARYEMGGPFRQDLDPPSAGGIDDQGVAIATVGFNYYIDGQDVKWTTDFGYAIDPISTFMVVDQTGWRPDPENHGAQFLIRSQLQLMF